MPAQINQITPDNLSKADANIQKAVDRLFQKLEAHNKE